VPRSSSPSAAIALSAVLDVVLVLVFVLVGRSSHAEALNPIGILQTLWPFLAGLVVGWLVIRAWRRPLAIVWTGIVAWVATVAVGMILRVVSGQGIALSFVIVATIVLGLFLLGWRAVAALIRSLRARARSARAETTAR
jgi:hypothetical protein